jgi:hypothetical protein
VSRWDAYSAALCMTTGSLRTRQDDGHLDTAFWGIVLLVRGIPLNIRQDYVLSRDERYPAISSSVRASFGTIR